MLDRSVLNEHLTLTWKIVCLTLTFERVKSSKYAFSFLKNFTYIPQNFQLPFPSFSQILSLTITSLHNPPKKNRKEKELPIRAISITISDDPFHQQRWSFSLIKLNMCFLVRVCSSIFGLALMGLFHTERIKQEKVA